MSHAHYTPTPGTDAASDDYATATTMGISSYGAVINALGRYAPWPTQPPPSSAVVS
jgi:hypothetical protein